MKVLCLPSDCVAGGTGKRKGKPLKQGGALARFHEWFGSRSLMNTLYVWFPASWGPSVVEAISKRNQTWLQQHPVHRDPAMFTASQVASGPASREMVHKIQKWNVKSKEVHPLLVANARVDWMALEDSELTEQFAILQEGILRDVFSQRTSSAWQGMQPQRLTVSLLLPGRSSAEWVAFLQSQRQFWPVMTTPCPLFVDSHSSARGASRNQSICGTLLILIGASLTRSCSLQKPTGLSREHLWNHLFVAKHRPNPFQELEYQGSNSTAVWAKWSDDCAHIGAYKTTKTLSGINADVATTAFDVDNRAARRAVEAAKEHHARRWQTKEGTYRLKKAHLPDVRDSDVAMVPSTMDVYLSLDRWARATFLCWMALYGLGGPWDTGIMGLFMALVLCNGYLELRGFVQEFEY